MGRSIREEIPVATDTAHDGLAETRRLAHPNCFVCGASANLKGLGLEFVASEGGGVQATFDCRAQFEGYAGKLHGGIISALLDGAMTNCVFALGETALTAELVVRYKHPVLIGETATIRGWIESRSRRLCLTKASLVQGGQLKVSATAKFIISDKAL